MSGGVDSSVAAALLKEEGYEVIGVTMQIWDGSVNIPAEERRSGCYGLGEAQDLEELRALTTRLGIRHVIIPLATEYRQWVLDYFRREYLAGRTPNPDVLCNREIKFKAFYNKAKEFGADYIATGHYCQTDQKHRLLKGLDAGKDQSYFLYMVSSTVLKEVLFPIGHLEKKQVRELATKYNLSTKDKKDSTGICFIGERNFKNFLSNYLMPQVGFFKKLNGENKSVCVTEIKNKAYNLIKWRFYDLEERAEDFMMRGLADKESVVDFIVKTEENKVKFNEADSKEERKNIILDVRNDWKDLVRKIRENVAG